MNHPVYEPNLKEKRNLDKSLLRLLNVTMDALNKCQINTKINNIII